MVHVPEEKRKKWGAKAQEQIFIGYCENSAGYKLIAPSSKKIVQSRDVVFFEERRMEGTSEISKEENEQTCPSYLEIEE